MEPAWTELKRISSLLLRSEMHGFFFTFSFHTLNLEIFRAFLFSERKHCGVSSSQRLREEKREKGKKKKHLTAVISSHPFTSIRLYGCNNEAVQLWMVLETLRRTGCYYKATCTLNLWSKTVKCVQWLWECKTRHHDRAGWSQAHRHRLNTAGQEYINSHLLDVRNTRVYKLWFFLIDFF